MRELSCSDLDILFKNKECSLEELGLKNVELRYNEYFILNNCSKHQVIAYYTINDVVTIAKLPKSPPVSVKFPEHHAAIHALMVNPDLKVVMLHGSAGGGKSYVSMGCGLGLIAKTKSEMKKLLLIRNNCAASSYTLGLLPGSKNEKMSPWFSPANDILEELLETDQLSHLAGGSDYSNDSELGAVSYLMNSGILDLTTPEYLRGASKHNTFVIVDDVQNFTIPEMDLLMTRFGTGSKVVLSGDESQVDNKMTNGANSGMALIKRMINEVPEFSKIATIIEFQNSELRGEIVKAYVDARNKLRTKL